MPALWQRLPSSVHTVEMCRRKSAPFFFFLPLKLFKTPQEKPGRSSQTIRLQKHRDPSPLPLPFYPNPPPPSSPRHRSQRALLLYASWLQEDREGRRLVRGGWGRLGRSDCFSSDRISWIRPFGIDCVRFGRSELIRPNQVWQSCQTSDVFMRCGRKDSFRKSLDFTDQTNWQTSASEKTRCWV